MICTPPIGWHMRAGGVVDQPRHRRGAGQLGAGAPGRRRAARRRSGSDCDAHRAAHPVVRHRLRGSMPTSPTTGFDELRELCAAAGDKASLAIGMVGLVTEHSRCTAGVREASRLASEPMALVESIGDPTLDGRAVLRGDRREARDRRDGRGAAAGRRPSSTWPTVTPPKGTSFSDRRWRWRWRLRGIARWALGRAGWRDDFDRALAMARAADPMSHAIVITYTYGLAIPVRGAAGRRRRAARHRGGAGDRRAIQ